MDRFVYAYVDAEFDNYYWVPVNGDVDVDIEIDMAIDTDANVDIDDVDVDIRIDINIYIDVNESCWFVVELCDPC